jgi:MoxR-like ATPase
MARATRSPSINLETFKRSFDLLVDNIETVIKGKTDIVRLSLVAILCEGHILFEDVPGTGKSMLARAIAQSIQASSNRIQCTPDMLPGDITGSSIFDQNRAAFEFKPGPLFTNILLADEVNRATPKTQSALLEAMAERRASNDGVTRDLPRPFIVLATQNPVEQAGTFPLPEAQLDRFLFRLSMGYLAHDDEYEVMFANSLHPAIDDIEGVIDTKTVEAMIAFGGTVEVAPEVGHYIIHLVQATRTDPACALGASPRAAIALVRAARVLAASDGRFEVFPDDVLTAITPVMGHRLILHPEATLRGETVEGVLERVVSSVKPPRGSDLPAAAGL